jgi:hypothetical protein
MGGQGSNAKTFCTGRSDNGTSEISEGCRKKSAHVCERNLAIAGTYHRSPTIPQKIDNRWPKVAIFFEQIINFFHEHK